MMNFTRLVMGAIKFRRIIKALIQLLLIAPENRAKTLLVSFESEIKHFGKGK